MESVGAGIESEAARPECAAISADMRTSLKESKIEAALFRIITPPPTPQGRRQESERQFRLIASFCLLNDIEVECEERLSTLTLILKQGYFRPHPINIRIVIERLSSFHYSAGQRAADDNQF